MFKKIQIIVFLWCFVVTIAHPRSVCQSHHCVAVVDAGSTGSRLHLYAYDLNEQNDPINIEPVWSNKVKPGFATITPSQLSIDAYLDSLFTTMPEENIPVYFYATAGMRLISAQKQTQYYDALNQWVVGNPRIHLVTAKTITGREEGVFGWLAVNYKIGALQSENKSLAGVMDMGGASVQITFPASSIEQNSSNDAVNVDIYHRHITLFTHSFLGLGQTELSHQYLNKAACFSNDYPLPDGEMGAGNAYDCQDDISRLINEVQRVHDIVNPMLVQNTVHDWYAISGLSALVKSKPFHFLNNEFTSTALLTTVDNEFCQVSWQHLLEQYPNNEYAYVNCLTASYYYGLLVNGYGLPANQSIHYLPDNNDVDWTLGVVLKHRV